MPGIATDRAVTNKAPSNAAATDPHPPTPVTMQSKKNKARKRRPTTRLARLAADMEKIRLRFETHKRRVIAMVATPAELECLVAMSPVEIAARLRISLSTVHAMCATRRLPARRSGRTWIVDVRDVLALEAKCGRRMQPDAGLPGSA